MAIIEDDKDKQVYSDSEPPIVKGIRAMFQPNTQQDYDRLSDNIGGTLKENMTPFVTYDPDKPGTTMAIPRLPLGTGTRNINVPSVNVDWSTGKRTGVPVNSNIVNRAISTPNELATYSEPAMGISHTVGSYPKIADKRNGTEATPNELATYGEPATDNIPDISAYQKDKVWTNEDMAMRYPEGGRLPFAYNSASLPNGSFVARTDDPNATPLSQGEGINTGDIDLAGLLSKYLGPSGQQGTDTSGIPMTTGKGWFSALMGISRVINDQKRAQKSEAQRWHRGIEMTKLVSDAMDKNRRHGLDTRKLGLEEQEYGYKKPYYEAQSKEAGSRAGLYDVQAKNQLSLPEQKEMDFHKFAISEANKAAAAAEANPMNEKSADDVYNAIYNRIMNSFNNANKAKQMNVPTKASSPYPEGTKLKGPGGKPYIVINGEAVPDKER